MCPDESIRFFCIKNEQCFNYGSREWLHKKYSLNVEYIYNELVN